MLAAKAAVIGPAPLNEGPVGNFQYPPLMDLYGENMLWRGSFRDCAMNFQACADGGDTKSKGIVAFLALVLYI